MHTFARKKELGSNGRCLMRVLSCKYTLMLSPLPHNYLSMMNEHQLISLNINPTMTQMIDSYKREFFMGTGLGCESSST